MNHSNLSRLGATFVYSSGESVRMKFISQMLEVRRWEPKNDRTPKGLRITPPIGMPGKGFVPVVPLVACSITQITVINFPRINSNYFA